MPLSIEELDQKYSKLLKDAFSGDAEGDHIKFDELLCEALSELGMTRTVAAYNETEKWYA